MQNTMHHQVHNNYAVVIKQKKVTNNHFLSKLHQILNNENYSQLVQWSDSGQGFKILNKDLFYEQVVKREFSASKYSSFIRQLSVYGFKISKNSKNEKEYVNPYFLKENTHTQLIQKKIKMKFDNLEEKIENSITNQDLLENSKCLFDEIRVIKQQQLSLIRQLKIAGEIQEKLEFNIFNFQSKTDACKKEEEFGYKLLDLFLSLVLGFKKDNFINASQILLQAIQFSPIHSYDSPIPFYKLLYQSTE